MPKKLLFENVTCGRCGGSGSYSYNMMHGSVCYGCNGAGVKLTKRGRAAQNFLNALRNIPVENFKVGDLILYEGLSSAKFSKISEVVSGPGSMFGYGENAEFPCVKIVCGEGSLVAFAGKSVARKGFSGAEKEAQKALALEFQASLNKAGKALKAAA